MVIDSEFQDLIEKIVNAKLRETLTSHVTASALIEQEEPAMEQEEIDKLLQNYTVHTHKRKRFLKSEIEHAIKVTNSANQAAKYLGVHWTTFKRWAKMYGVYEQAKNQAGRGVIKSHKSSARMSVLEDILAGNRPNFEQAKFKAHLLMSGTLSAECDNCGFCEKRLTDNKTPLLIDYLDGDKTNKTLTNIRLLCYNCYFLMVGQVTSKKRE